MRLNHVKLSVNFEVKSIFLKTETTSSRQLDNEQGKKFSPKAENI